MRSSILLSFLLVMLGATGQQKDSVIAGKQVITLSEVVISNKLDVPYFINKIKDDSSFYKAFKNLRILGYTAINDIRMVDKKGRLKASLSGKIKQVRIGDCRTMQKLEEQVTGDFYTSNGDFNYYTAKMYASLFFTEDTVCNETNIVKGHEFNLEGKKGLEKHKEQLKMLFFNPGKRIEGIPFMKKKTEIFDDNLADAYDMSIDMDIFNQTNCYILRQKVKPGMEDRVVIDEMNTWFDDKNYEVIARNYRLSYNALVYDFDVRMEVIMTRFNDLTVPAVIRYNGNWKAITRKRELGIFTATLFDFNEETH